MNDLLYNRLQNAAEYEPIKRPAKKAFAASKTYKVVWTNGNNLFVIRRGKTNNDKISDPKAPIIQTYTFSMDQYNLVHSGKEYGMKDFYALDQANCLDCPRSGNSGDGTCYTHKYGQYRGFLMMLKSIDITQITPFNANKHQEILDMCAGLYVRFGTYGEPSLMSLELVSDMAAIAKNWTGYTHQSTKNWAQGFANYFMASKEGDSQNGWRSFATIRDAEELPTAVSCPASKEMGYKSICSKCGLCSGNLGKGKKDIKIIVH